MAIYSGATQRLLKGYDVARGGTIRAVVLHSTAGGANSPYGSFANGGACSHFWVGYDGQVEQFMDTSWKDAADLYAGGGPYAVSIETASNTSGSDSWNAAQVAAIVKLVAWICKTHSIPVEVSSYAGDPGIGWHRLGVDGNFPSGLLGGRQQIGRGDLWSASKGKVCPGDNRIKQVGSIVVQVAAALGDVKTGGGSSVPSAPTPAPKPAPAPSGLTVDGSWGPATTKALQKHFGTTQDGVISGQVKGAWNAAIPSISFGSGGSQLVAAMQKTLGVAADGNLGPATIKALQKHEGTTQDGTISNPSACVIAMQKHLNGGTW